MSEKGLPSLLERHWAESALAIGAVVIAAVSLWMAYDTDLTNRELVASQSWPYIQVYESDETGTTSGPPVMSLDIANNGIGPAKLESFELFWKGKPQHNPWQLLQTCCAQAQGSRQPGDLVARWHGDLGTSSDEGVVVRAGNRIPFLELQRNATDAAAWDTFRTGVVHNLSVRYCYCSAFDECWLATQKFGQRHQMNPPRVRSCPRPDVSYDNFFPAATPIAAAPGPSGPPPRTGPGAP